MVNTVPVGDLADEDEVLTNDGLYDIVLDLNVGDWVVVKYDGEKFPGEFIQIIQIRMLKSMSCIDLATIPLVTDHICYVGERKLML